MYLMILIMMILIIMRYLVQNTYVLPVNHIHIGRTYIPLRLLMNLMPWVHALSVVIKSNIDFKLNRLLQID